MTINATDTIALTQALIRCESVTPHEGGALTLLQNVLEPAGFACHRLPFTEPGTPDVDNLYARLGDGRPHLCFAGHTDVVPAGDEKAWMVPPFSGEVRNGILYGRGAVDMKGCVAAFVAAALRYIHTHGGRPPRGSISFLITGDEEGPSINGTAKVLHWLKDRDEAIDACIVGEPSNPKALGDEIKIGRRGSLNAEIVVAGKQGHAAYPQLADNPVPKLARILDRLVLGQARRRHGQLPALEPASDRDLRARTRRRTSYRRMQRRSSTSATTTPGPGRKWKPGCATPRRKRRPRSAPGSN